MRRSFVCLIVSAVAIVSGNARPFQFPADTFAFSNETYYEYKASPGGQLLIQRRPNGTVPDYSRYCFVLTRAVLQFYRFGEFRPDLPSGSEAEYRQVIRRISRIPPWSSGPRSKIEIPGYRNLYDFSLAHRILLQKNIGRWWPTFWRIGNWRIVFPVPRSSQQELAYWLQNSIDSERIHAVFLTRFKPINHCLVPYNYTAKSNNDLVFLVYDPNQPGKIVHLRYRVSDRSFYFDPTWYYPGGLVNIMKLYVSPLI